MTPVYKKAPAETAPSLITFGCCGWFPPFTEGGDCFCGGDLLHMDTTVMGTVTLTEWCLTEAAVANEF